MSHFLRVSTKIDIQWENQTNNEREYQFWGQFWETEINHKSSSSSKSIEPPQTQYEIAYPEATNQTSSQTQNTSTYRSHH